MSLFETTIVVRDHYYCTLPLLLLGTTVIFEFTIVHGTIMLLLGITIGFTIVVLITCHCSGLL